MAGVTASGLIHFPINTLELGNEEEFFVKSVLTVYDNSGKWERT